ncbi:MAG TPA: hypothetical protein PLP23_10645 [Panacibacter sp.]|nr:hypothetical protein [Panacibacter sp.]
MKNKLFSLFLAAAVFIGTESFYTDEKVDNGKSYNLIYVDNSKADNYASLSIDMIDFLSRKIDTIKGNPDARFMYFVSNSTKPEISQDAVNAQKLVNKLSNGNNRSPNSLLDKTFLGNQIFDQNLSKTTSINLYFFVGEYYLMNDMMGENSGLLLKFFPKELENLTNCPEEKINVIICYPKNAKSFNENKARDFLNFEKKQPEFISKINLKFQAI